jgi:hypothetical protein
VLFHVTITHDQRDCPGRRAVEAPVLIAGPSQQLETLGQELGVTSHGVLWGAPCILWAEPEHIAYAVLEAPDLDAVLRYMQAVVPVEWAVRALPVFSVPGQLPLLQQLLSAPVTPFRQPAAESADSVAARISAADSDTVPNAAVAAPAQTEFASVAPPAAGSRRSSSSATRFVERPTVDAPSGRQTSGSETPRPAGSITELLADLHASGPREGGEHGPLAQGTDIPPSAGTTIVLGRMTLRGPVVRLQATAGPSQGSIFEVGAAGGTVGRLPENLIHLVDGRVSRQHARIEFRDREFWISDLASQNGTLVNGQVLSEAHRLQTGDTIGVGTSRFTVTLSTEPGE